MPFAQDVELTGPAELKAWENDVDRMGNDLTQFTKNCLLDLLFWGRCIILVDSPIGPEDAPTVAEQQDQRLFPYFIRIPPALARNWLADPFERYLRLNVLSTVETVDPVNEWEVVAAEQVRVYRPGLIETWARGGHGGQGRWQKTEADKPWWGLEPFIPVAHAYGEKLGPVPRQERPT